MTPFSHLTKDVQARLVQHPFLRKLRQTKWYQHLLSKKHLLGPFCFLLALCTYGFLIRNELLVSKNDGNIKIVAIKSKDPLSNGYKENIRTNLLVNGQRLDSKSIVRNDWGQYGASIPIPIFTADAQQQENQTLEIQHDGPIKTLSLEYSSYDVGGYLQIYLDNVLYTQVNTYNKELVYKPLHLSFDPHYALHSSTIFWWLQLLILFLFVVLSFLRARKTDPTKSDRKRLKQLALAIGLVLATLVSLHKAFQYGDTRVFHFFNTQLTPLTVPIFLASFSALAYLLHQSLPYLRKLKLQIIGQFLYGLTIAATPFISLYLIETAYSINSVEQLSAADYQANILILSVIFLTAAFLLTSLRRASIFLILGSLSVGIVTKILLISRNMPLLSYHFLQIRDGLSVVGDTDFSFTPTIFSLIFTAWLYVIVLAFLPPFHQLFHFRWKNNQPHQSSIFSRFANLNQTKQFLIKKGSLVLIGLVSLVFISRPTIYYIANKVDLSLYFWTLQSTYYDHGLPVALTRYHLASQITEPEGYSTETVKQILSDYPKTDTTSTKKPNIVMIMNESLTDYSSLTDLEFSSDPLEYIHSLDRNTVKGNLITSVFAGSTANTEYEALTSNSLAILPPNAFPFQQYISSEQNSIVNYLNQLDYSSYAMHPYGKDNYRRSQVYGYFGFEESYFENSSPGIQDLVEKPERIRGYISDASLYRGTEKLIKENEKPVFNFIVTMQGHGGYNTSEQDFPRTISIENAENNTSATDYLSSVDDSDKAFEEFTTSLMQNEEPTIVLMFGDHHPILTDSYFKPHLDAADPRSRYQTPFVIWANFDLPKQEQEQTISPNYLVPQLLQTLSQTNHALPISSYYHFLSQLQKEIPVMTTWGYYDNENTYSDTQPVSEKYQHYRQIVYNNVTDKHSLKMEEYQP